MRLREFLFYVNGLIEELGRKRTTDLLAYGLACYSVITGLVLAYFPREPWVGPPYSRALELASPELWGWLMVAGGAFVALGFWIDGRAAKFPALALTLVYGALGYLMAIDPYKPGGDGSPTVAVAHLFAAWIAAAVVVTCGGKRR